MHVYWRTNQGRLGQMEVTDSDDHEEAILLVKEWLVTAGEGYDGAVLAVIVGGKHA